MANVATVSFKLSPGRYAVLKAMATGEGRSVSEFVRDLVSESLELDQQVERLVPLFAPRREAGACAGCDQQVTWKTPITAPSAAFQTSTARGVGRTSTAQPRPSR